MHSNSYFDSKSASICGVLTTTFYFAGFSKVLGVERHNDIEKVLVTLRSLNVNKKTRQIF